MKLILIAILALLITSCAEFSAMKTGVATHGADAADEAVTVNLWALCEASTVGAIKRRFKTQEERDAYNAVCPVGELP